MFLILGGWPLACGCGPGVHGGVVSAVCRLVSSSASSTCTCRCADVGVRAGELFLCAGSGCAARGAPWALLIFRWRSCSADSPVAPSSSLAPHLARVLVLAACWRGRAAGELVLEFAGHLAPALPLALLAAASVLHGCAVTAFFTRVLLPASRAAGWSLLPWPSIRRPCLRLCHFAQACILLLTRHSCTYFWLRGQGGCSRGVTGV